MARSRLRYNFSIEEDVKIAIDEVAKVKGMSSSSLINDIMKKIISDGIVDLDEVEKVKK